MSIKARKSSRPSCGNKDDLLRKIWSKEAKVAVVGLGYTGLPFAVEVSHSGYKVIGYDKDKERIDSVNSPDELYVKISVSFTDDPAVL